MIMSIMMMLQKMMIVIVMMIIAASACRGHYMCFCSNSTFGCHVADNDDDDDGNWRVSTHDDNHGNDDDGDDADDDDNCRVCMQGSSSRIMDALWPKDSQGRVGIFKHTLYNTQYI